MGVRRAISVSNSVGRANFHARTGLRGWKVSAGISREFGWQGGGDWLWN